MFYQVVAPKKRSLESAEAVLATQMAKLEEKRAELKAVTDELNELEDNLASNQNEKEVKKMFKSFIFNICSYFN